MNDTQHRTIDRSDPRWYDAAALAGITFAASIGQLTVEPSIATFGIAAGLLVVFVAIVWGLKPEGE